VPDDYIASPYGLVVIQQRFRIVQPELHEPLFNSFFFLSQQRFAAYESSGLIELDGKSEARLEWRILIGNIVAPVALAFFHA